MANSNNWSALGGNTSDVEPYNWNHYTLNHSLDEKAELKQEPHKGCNEVHSIIIIEIRRLGKIGASLMMNSCFKDPNNLFYVHRATQKEIATNALRLLHILHPCEMQPYRVKELQPLGNDFLQSDKHVCGLPNERIRAALGFGSKVAS